MVYRQTWELPIFFPYILGRPVGTWVLISFSVKWSELCLSNSCKCTLKSIKHYVNSPIYIKKQLL